MRKIKDRWYVWDTLVKTQASPFYPVKDWAADDAKTFNEIDEGDHE